MGRIGRAFLRLAVKHPEIEIVALNDVGDPHVTAYLLKYDTVYGRAPFPVEVKDGTIALNGTKIVAVSERDPSKLPWGKLGVDLVIESTGVFESYEKASAHLKAGAKRVLITAPTKDDPPAEISGGTVLMGINEKDLATCRIISNASCTTNAGSPLIAILDEAIGIEKALLNTVHAYTGTQELVDSAADKKDVRRGRAAAANIVPSSTGAAIAVTKVLPQLKGKFDGVSVRVPVAVGSLVDITFVAKKNTSVEEVNHALKKAATEPKWKGIFTATDEPIVSSDIIGDTHASIADLSYTKVVDGNLVKVFAWYDNEMGYANTLILQVLEIAKHLS